MASPPATIEQLARETVEIDDPETALRALTALRRELDATEPEIVRRALQVRASWSQIARALGISKQAAHRKYRHLFEQTDTPVEKRIAVSAQARECIQFAREEAKRLAQPAVATEHILLGLLRCRGSEALEHLLLALLSDSRNGAVQTLEELRTTSERIRRRLDRLRAGDAALDLPSELRVAEVQLTSRSRPVSTS
jgi:ATP-dependent Clp protease ATP-binding subunit ClpA